MTEDQEIKERRRKALLLGLGTTGGLAAAHTGYHGVRDLLDNAKVPKSNSWKDFLGKLDPADLVYYRQYGAKDKKALGHVYDLISGVKGDEYLHPSVYRGKGMISEAGGYDIPAKAKVRMSGSDYPIEAKAYRFSDLSPAEQKKAFSFLDKTEGARYKSSGEVAKHGLGHLAGMKIPTGKCKPGKDGIVCSELVTEAFPKRFKDRLMSPINMRHADKSELVARYGKSVSIPMRERLLARVGYPLMKNAKWGLLAGAAGYGAMNLMGDDNARAT